MFRRPIFLRVENCRQDRYREVALWYKNTIQSYSQHKSKISLGKESDSKKKEGKTTNTFDKALASMIKTLNSCHFDQALKEQSLYCEPLMNALPNFQLKLCFGFHYGSAIEGIQMIVLLI
jgi:hypothetical protein